MDVKDKIEIFRRASKDSILIISDFDATLTKGLNKDGTMASNSFSVF